MTFLEFNIQLYQLLISFYSYLIFQSGEKTSWYEKTFIKSHKVCHLLDPNAT
jgi:hypothetical protein